MKLTLNRRTIEVIAVAAALSVATLVAGLYLGGPSGPTISTTCPAEQCTTSTSQTISSATTTTATSSALTTSSIQPPTTTLTTSTTTTPQQGTTSTTATNTSATTSCCNGSYHSLGFWLQESDIMEQYSASTFFNAMFLTPPYPSSLEVMIFAVLQDQTNNEGCSVSSGYTGASASYWGDVAELADSYPHIRLIFEIAFNASQDGSGPYGLSCFDTLVKALDPYPSVYAIGIEGEYTTPTSALTPAVMQAAMGDVTSTGKLFINYYIPTDIIPTGGYDIAQTNFPAQGDQVGSLQKADVDTVGLSSGYYDSFAFPSTFTCPIGPDDVANGALTNEPQGYNSCVVTTEISAALSLPGSERQFLELVPGFSSSGNFVGASGQVTDQLWDNTALRGWIWSDPSYASNFVLST